LRSGRAPPPAAGRSGRGARGAPAPTAALSAAQLALMGAPAGARAPRGEPMTAAVALEQLRGKCAAATRAAHITAQRRGPRHEEYRQTHWRQTQWDGYCVAREAVLGSAAPWLYPPSSSARCDAANRAIQAPTMGARGLQRRGHGGGRRRGGRSCAALPPTRAPRELRPCCSARACTSAAVACGLPRLLLSGCRGCGRRVGGRGGRTRAHARPPALAPRLVRAIG